MLGPREVEKLYIYVVADPARKLFTHLRVLYLRVAGQSRVWGMARPGRVFRNNNMTYRENDLRLILPCLPKRGRLGRICTRIAPGVSLHSCQLAQPAVC